MPHDSSESQAAKEIRISFGDLHKKVYRACAAANLSGIESNLLQAMIGHLDRSSYKANLSDILTHKREYWADMMAMEPCNISRTLKPLLSKGFLTRIKIGARVNYRLSDYFVAYILCPTDHAFLPFMEGEGIKADTSQKKVSRLIPNRYQARHLTGIKADTSALYIEDSLSSIPSLYSPQTPKSASPKGNAGVKLTLRALAGGLKNLYVMMDTVEAEGVIRILRDQGHKDSDIWAVISGWILERSQQQFNGQRAEQLNKAFAVTDMRHHLKRAKACITAKE